MYLRRTRNLSVTSQGGLIERVAWKGHDHQFHILQEVSARGYHGEDRNTQRVKLWFGTEMTGKAGCKGVWWEEGTIKVRPSSQGREETGIPG